MGTNTEAIQVTIRVHCTRSVSSTFASFSRSAHKACNTTPHLKHHETPKLLHAKDNDTSILHVTFQLTSTTNVIVLKEYTMVTGGWLHYMYRERLIYHFKSQTQHHGTLSRDPFMSLYIHRNTQKQKSGENGEGLVTRIAWMMSDWWCEMDVGGVRLVFKESTRLINEWCMARKDSKHSHNQQVHS